MIGMPGIALKGDEFVPGKVLEQSTSRTTRQYIATGNANSTLGCSLLFFFFSVQVN